MSDRSVPAFDGGGINFNAQHSCVGAFMSFTCGHFGGGGGIGVEIGKPANQNIYVGVKRGGRESRHAIKCLPFVRGGSFTSAAANFHVDQAHTAPPASVECYRREQIKRHFGWASDAWATDDGLAFTIYTPFAPIPEPGSGDTTALRASVLPAIVATLRIDNRGGSETRTAIFALDFPETGTRLLRPTASDEKSTPAPPAAASKLGFAHRRSLGVLGMLEDAPSDSADDLFAFQRWSVAEGVADVNPVHELGSCGGIGVEVPAGQSRTIVLAIGCYLDGIVTTGLEGRYYYTRFYAGLEEVLTAALQRSRELRDRAARLDAKLLASRLSRRQQFLIAHGTRGYYGSTQLLDVGGEAFFIVNEGEYCMMNTLDLAIDQAFWELRHNPWVVRNILDNFSRHYSYHDTVRARGGAEALPGGVSFTHDMGVNNNFARPGHSAYELPHLVGCFSHMTQEQLCNWILLAACYVAKTGDRKWLAENAPLLAACATSLRNRAHPRTGIMACDSSRCEDGQEITTYDSLDESLGQARSNTYLAVKCWAAWTALEMLSAMNASSLASDDRAPFESLAPQIAQHLCASVGADGTLPAVLEKDNPGYRSRILPVVEGLIYPFYWLNCLRERAGAAAAGGAGGAGAAGAGDDGDNDEARQVAARALRSPLVETLRRHTMQLLADPRKPNLFPDGGIKLSSTSTNSWMSKIALFQHVCRQVLRLHEAPQVAELFAAADAAHVRWQSEGSSFWACSDQFVSGVAKASRYYPRLITAALWLDESPKIVTTITAPRQSPRVTAGR